MKTIYVDRVPNGEYQDFILRRGDSYFMRLHGVNVNVQDGTVYVEPVYLPLLTISNDDGQLFIQVNTGKQDFVCIYLTRYFPFVTVFQSHAIQLENEEDE
jgi:hypothetical protein